ncbi:MAG TPA: discoidin domain-containing protein [Treponemataceae bacterium]|nr:discoidin domain-containing protein [Treponemataceae bacterium]
MTKPTNMRFSTHMALIALQALLVLLISAALLSCGRKIPDGEFSVTDHDSRFVLSVAGSVRNGSMHVPKDYDPSKKYSLLFALHGGSQNSSYFDGKGFDALADKLDFIVVYPNGVGMRWDSPNDAPFFVMIKDKMLAKYSIDPTRVYATGHSAGAFEAYELATYVPGLFTAIAPVCGAVMGDAPMSALEPVSVLHVCMVDDPEVAFGGMRDWNFLSAEESVNVWRRAAGGLGVPVPDSVPMPRDRLSASRETFFDGHGIKGTLWHGAKADCALLAYGAGGHIWPQRATEEIMRFFYNHPARGATVEIDSGELPVCVWQKSRVKLGVKASGPDKIKKVSYWSNAKKIGDADKAPFEIPFDADLAGLNLFRAEATLVDGSVIKSTRDPFLLVAARADAKDTPAMTGSSSIIPIVSARSSANEDSYLEPPNAIDGDFYSRWGSGWTDEQWLILDLGSPRLVSGVSILWESAWAREYSIELSADGVSWTREARVNASEGGVGTLSFKPSRARYVRFSGHKRGTEWGYSFWEIFIHGE